MNEFDVFSMFGKKIVGLYKANSDRAELLLDDGSKVVFLAEHGYQGGLMVDYVEKI